MNRLDIVEVRRIIGMRLEELRREGGEKNNLNKRGRRVGKEGESNMKDKKYRRFWWISEGRREDERLRLSEEKRGEMKMRS